LVKTKKINPIIVKNPITMLRKGNNIMVMEETKVEMEGTCSFTGYICCIKSGTCNFRYKQKHIIFRFFLQKERYLGNNIGDGWVDDFMIEMIGYVEMV